MRPSLPSSATTRAASCSSRSGSQSTRLSRCGAICPGGSGGQGYVGARIRLLFSSSTCVGPHTLSSSSSPVRWSSPPATGRESFRVPLSRVVLTPCPPLPAGEGERGAIFERPAQQRCEVVACHIAVRDADDSITCGLQDCRTRGIMRPSLTPRVRRALKLEHQPLGGAVEVNDEPVQHVLAPKLEAEGAPITQQRPRVSLGGRRVAAQLARLRELPAGRDAPERIHTAYTRAASSRHQNENIAPWSMLLRLRGGGTGLPLSRRERG